LGRFDGCAPPADGLGILELVQSGDGRIFFAAADGRLWVLNPADTDRRARPLDAGAFAPLTGITALAQGPGSAIWAAAQGRLYKVDLAGRNHDTSRSPLAAALSRRSVPGHRTALGTSVSAAATAAAGCHRR
jgi:hypothetical protein